jgi:hypothetical protein
MQDQIKDDQVQENQEAEEGKALEMPPMEMPSNDSEPMESNGAVDSLFAVEGLIKNHLEQIDNLSLESKRLKEMFDDMLVNDAEYSKAEDAAKESIKAKTVAKKTALAKPEAETITNKLKDVKETLKDLGESLSLHLQQYAKLSGSDTLEVEPGDIRQIVYKARLIKSPTNQQ